jgi:uncharacterized alpha/beta hydrolase family protein
MAITTKLAVDMEVDVCVRTSNMVIQRKLFVEDAGSTAEQFINGIDAIRSEIHEMLVVSQNMEEGE